MFAPQEPIDILEDKFAQVRSLPSFGTAGLYTVIVLAGVTAALALASTSRPKLLNAARSAAYATCGLVLFDLLLLAYAFLSHDFRIRYVARYSDRSMPVGYLFTALWGGQDGSLLWWLFLLSVNTSACVLWLRGKYRELQPYIIATLMVVMMFFVAIMTFSANPFGETVAGARVDGEGLNPLLQNFYMIIHPPMLYSGFVGCTVPFAFGIAALASGRLDEEWLVAVRKWMLVGWTFLSIGNVLGMAWAYEELGWGGHWAWDPVENAAFMPWLSASAFVHSMMVQERRRMLKVWNIVLLSLTFFMTILGTFLTRSGMIKSVHAFAQSNIGVYFSYFMVTIVSVTTALVVYRLPELKNLTDREKATAEYHRTVGRTIAQILTAELVIVVAERLITPKMAPVGITALVTFIVLVLYGVVKMGIHFPKPKRVKVMEVSADGRVREVRPKLDSVFSREAAFIANNWILLAMQAFVCITTLFPLFSETLAGETVTVGPGFYNRWMVPLGLSLFALMGIGPLLGWRKTSHASLRRAFRIPLIGMGVVLFLHVAIGRRFGFPFYVESERIYPGILGTVLQKLTSIFPLLATGLAAFNITVVVQEYSRGLAARRRANPDEGFLSAFVSLVAKARRRYGGYVVHVGIVAMFLGFTGGAYKVDKEFAFHEGETVSYEGYDLTYLGYRRDESDPSAMKLFMDIKVEKDHKTIGVMSPARFVYRRQGMATSEVAIRVSPREDLYLAPGSINPETHLVTLHAFVNPLEVWIWLGAFILFLGAMVATWPEAALGEVGVTAYLRTAGATAASLVLGLLLALTPARAQADPMPASGGGGSSSMASGDVQMATPEERELFDRLLCQCGDCPRLKLSQCGCGWAESMRGELRERLASGSTVDSLADEYAKRFGIAALDVPPSRGGFRLLWLVPLSLVLAGGVGAIFLVRRWSRKGPPGPTNPAGEDDRPADDYDAKLDRELRDLE